jgi:formylglycine-generating enzyme required for sulfatase activity
MIKILFLSANPRGVPKLALEKEANAIADALRRAKFGRHFKFATKYAVRVGQIQELLLKHRPHVVHFSGHGAESGEIILEDEAGYAYAVTPEALKGTFVQFREDVRLVVINACYSQPQAEAIAQCAPGVIGLKEKIADDAAIAFAAAFYQALAYGRDVQAAFDLGRNQLEHLHPGSQHIPQLAPGPTDLARLKLAVETPPAEWVQPRAALSPGHRKYLLQLFEQRWAGVSMSLFDPALGHKLSLLKIYTPLPVDFAIHAQADKAGRLDWWCGRRGEDALRGRETEALPRNQIAELGRRSKRGLAEEGFVRPQRWADLGVDEGALKPLVALTQEQLRQAQNRCERDRDEKAEITWEADAHHAALVQPRFVLIGDPGSGKSTFLRHLALCWAGEVLRVNGGSAAPAGAGLASLAGWSGPAHTPVYVELRSLIAGDAWALERAAAAPPGVLELREYLRARLTHEGCGAFTDELFDLLRGGKAAILLDGLDEVNQAADPRRRAQVQAFVGELAKQFRAAPIIITARPYAYGQDDWRLPGFGFTDLTPLDRPRQAELAGRVFAALAALDACLTPRGPEQEAAAFAEALAQIPEDLASNPLLLTLLMAIWLKTDACNRCLPDTRGALYRRGLDLLLEDWVRQKVEGFSLEEEYDLTAADLRFVLQLVAYEAQRRRTQPDEIAVISRGEIFEALETIGQGDIAAGLLRHLRLRAGMLLEAVEQSPGTLVAVYTQQFRFLHLSFQEYLAACEFLYREGDARSYRLPVWPDRRFPAGLAERLVAAPTLWANVLRLATDELLFQKRPLDAWELLARCCQPYREAGQAAEAAVISLGVAEEAGLFDALPDRRARADYEDLRTTALRALEDHKRLTPKQRDVAGRLLGRGPYPGHDPRKDIGVRANGLPDIKWVPIPDDGPFIYQKNERRTERTFWIAKYPITYAQYRSFLENTDGFRNPAWWRDLAAPDWNRQGPGEQRFSYWNHPTENVSWYDAVAFCRWLTARVKAEVRAKVAGWETLLPFELTQGQDWKITLPTEWQWEKAARGRAGRFFPRGGKKLEDYEPGYANIDETYGTKVGAHYLQKTSAVGMYPQGASPYGVLDMSGNVWEWCLNEYEKPDRIQEEGDTWRVLRGGSWYNDVEHASALARSVSWYSNRDDDIGFRVVVVRSSPSSSAL